MGDVQCPGRVRDQGGRLEVACRQDPEEIVGPAHPQVRRRQQAAGLRLGQALIGGTRADHRKVGGAGDRYLGACHVRIERPDHPHQGGIGDHLAQVALAQGRVTLPSGTVIEGPDHHRQAFDDPLVLVPERLPHRVDDRHPIGGLRAGLGHVDPDQQVRPDRLRGTGATTCQAEQREQGAGQPPGHIPR